MLRIPFFFAACFVAFNNAVRMKGSEVDIVSAGAVHSFFHLADPQLGMYNQYTQDASDWKQELAMFSRLFSLAASPSANAAFIFIGGDMQNTWPNEKNSTTGKPAVGRNRGKLFPKGEPPKPDPQAPSAQDDAFLLSGKLGEMQRNAVLSVTSQPGASTKIPVVYTAGNHDVGDRPDENTLAQYMKVWGPLQQHWVKDNICYIQLNSQVYVKDDHSAAAKQEKKLQNKWLKQTLSTVVKKHKGIKRVVMLTHVPPFMDNHKETAGWANWDKPDRNGVLDLLAHHFAPAGVPVLWVCGHFHTNVEKRNYKYQVKKVGVLTIDIIVTSASGLTMWWNGAHGDGHLTSKEASSVAGQAVGGAFFTGIMGSIPQPNQRSYFANMQPVPERSGMRKIVMNVDGSFETEWSTLAAALTKYNVQKKIDPEEVSKLKTEWTTLAAALTKSRRRRR